MDGTASYATIHAPYQQAPQSLTPRAPDLSDVPCGGQNATLADIHKLSDQMLEAMDTEIGRLLVETGVASRRADGTLDYDPEASNTMVIIIGDNGTYAQSVKAPFDIQHAKGWVNQTGVWVPLIVSGPLVNSPDREVQNMVNVADLFQLFGEIAGLDVRKFVPKARILDSVSMLPYLTNPSQTSLRTSNFTQTGDNISANGVRPGPCVIPIPSNRPTCVQIFPQKALCETEGGSWWGPGATPPQQTFNSCCDLLASGMIDGLKVLPLAQAAVRNDEFKLIQVTPETCDSEEQPLQLYKINENPGVARIDVPALNLIKDQNDPTAGLTPKQAENYMALKTELDSILNSEAQCPGDGNVDGIVNRKDIKNWFLFHNSGSSWYDFPVNGLYDGVTNEQDLRIILRHFGRPVRRASREL
jgi:hypothetical protein